MTDMTTEQVLTEIIIEALTSGHYYGATYGAESKSRLWAQQKLKDFMLLHGRKIESLGMRLSLTAPRVPEFVDVMLGAGDKMIADIYDHDGEWAGIGIFHGGKGVGVRMSEHDGKNIDELDAICLIRSTSVESLKVLAQECGEAIARMSGATPAPVNELAKLRERVNREAEEIEEVAGTIMDRYPGMATRLVNAAARLREEGGAPISERKGGDLDPRDRQHFARPELVEQELQHADTVPEVRVTENGEITHNPETGLFTVWDETYTEQVCVTSYKPIATAALKWYGEVVLGEKCHATQHSDQMHCLVCGNVWDMNDPEPPKCGGPR